MSEPDNSKKFYAPPLHDCLGKIKNMWYKGNSEENCLTIIKLYDYNDQYTTKLPYFRIILMEVFYRNLLVKIPGSMCRNPENFFSTFTVIPPTKDNNWTSLTDPTLGVEILKPGQKPGSS